LQLSSLTRATQAEFKNTVQYAHWNMLSNPTSRRRLACATIAAGLIPIGVAWRMAPLHLPPFLYKYGGSVLWAAMVYWLVAALLPRWDPVRIAGLACLIAALVEFSRLYRLPPLDAFRITLAGKLILGRFFSLWDIAAYWLAIGMTAFIDLRWVRAKFRSFHLH
jgi:hypothetical protein